MPEALQWGSPPWTVEDIKDSLDEFSELYDRRPIKENHGGMRAPHMFAVWHMVRKLQPDIIVESGIWKGQSTWLLEQASPSSKIFAIDLHLKHRQYISPKVTYLEQDFSECDWSFITDKSLAFFDDHQNAYTRLQQCKWFGFRHIIFEDNYPVTQGDCYSLKKALANAGFEPLHSRPRTEPTGLKQKIKKKLAGKLGITSLTLTPQYFRNQIQPNDVDARFIRKNLDAYAEFPPVFRTTQTRWGDDWNDDIYPTPQPVFEDKSELPHAIFAQEAQHYTWICYARLR